ncbi:HAMP domain-containing sensor histidine kinase [Williamsia sp. CHRR-6]|uniref:sensor histidine kinase n=1 Tax=Williamsia sp. CHRR-6 TaxID=2835871 RepID=UPI001BDA1DC7|nr:HAMP domain-containing sensor histidine kinase [Williamsia sp. CHRR-6]MBT0566444.1 HAMP domain-containing histidine kinase [Williamsia sp. CHRR-6]
MNRRPTRPSGSASLRTRVTLAAAAVTVVIVASVGAIVWTQVATSAYRELDARVDTLSAAAQPSISNPNATTVADSVADGVLATVRVGGVPVFSSPTQIPVQETGRRDLSINGVRYRVKTVSVLDKSILNGLAAASVAVPLKPTTDRINGQRNALLLIGLAAVGATALLAWLASGVAIRPLRRLAHHTEALAVDAPADDPERIALQSIRGAREAEDLAGAMTSLLARIDAERERTREALATARDFASVSAHELRTPLTAMRTDLEVLDTYAPDEAARREIVADLRRAHARVLETLSSLENLAQGDLGGQHRAHADVVDLLERVVTDSAARHRDVDVRLAGAQSVPGRINEAGLRMAVENAVTNAVRHGRARRVVVAAHPRGPSPTDGVEIWVDDDGVGVAPADRERVFARFERGTSGESGSGLGLALIAQQARLHGGTAHLTDSPMGGTRLVLTLGG